MALVAVGCDRFEGDTEVPSYIKVDAVVVEDNPSDSWSPDKGFFSSNVDAVNGSRSAGEMRSIPLAAASSITAVRVFGPSLQDLAEPSSPRNPYCAVIGRPRASCTCADRSSPPVVSTSAAVSPSPPSDSGMMRHSASGSPASTPRRIASATACADAASLNESGANRYLMAFLPVTADMPTSPIV